MRSTPASRPPRIPAAPGLAASLLTLAGGIATAIGAALPWLQVGYVLPDGKGTFEESGLHLATGQIVFGAGALTAALGMIMVIAPAARGTSVLPVMAITVVTATVGGGWLILGRNLEAAGPGVTVAAFGVLTSLAAAGSGLPRTRRERVTVLVAILTAAVLTAAVVILVGHGPSPLPKF
jgi:hypothetical protein